MAREKETKRQLIRKEAQINNQADNQDSELSWGEGSLFVSSFH